VFRGGDGDGDFAFSQEYKLGDDLGEILKGFIVRFHWNSFVDRKRRSEKSDKDTIQAERLEFLPQLIMKFEGKRGEENNIMKYTTLCTSYIAECYLPTLKEKFNLDEKSKPIYAEQFQIAMVMSGLLDTIFQDPYVAATLPRQYQNKNKEYDAAYGDEDKVLEKAHFCDHFTALPRFQISVSNMRKVLDPDLVGIAAFMASAIYDTSTLNNFRVLLGREGMEAEDMHPSFRSTDQKNNWRVYRDDEERQNEPNSSLLFETQFNSGKLFVKHMISPANRLLKGLMEFLDFKPTPTLIPSKPTGKPTIMNTKQSSSKPMAKAQPTSSKPIGKDRVKALLFRKVCSELVQAYATHGWYSTFDKKMPGRHPWLPPIASLLNAESKKNSFIQLMVEFVLLALNQRVIVVTMSHVYGTGFRFVDQGNGQMMHGQPKMKDFNFLFKIDRTLHGNPEWINKQWTFNELVNIIAIGCPDPFTKEFDAQTYKKTFVSNMRYSGKGTDTSDNKYIALMDQLNIPKKLYMCKDEKDEKKPSKKRKDPSSSNQKEKEVSALQTEVEVRRKKQKLNEAHEELDEDNQDLNKRQQQLRKALFDSEEDLEKESPLEFFGADEDLVEEDHEDVEVSGSDEDVDEDDEDQRKPAAKVTANDEDERKHEDVEVSGSDVEDGSDEDEDQRKPAAKETANDEEERKPAAKKPPKPAGRSKKPQLPDAVLAKIEKLLPEISADGANDKLFHKIFEKLCDKAVEWVNSCHKNERDEEMAADYVAFLRTLQRMTLAVSLQAAIQRKALAKGKCVVFRDQNGDASLRRLHGTTFALESGIDISSNE